MLSYLPVEVQVKEKEILYLDQKSKAVMNPLILMFAFQNDMFDFLPPLIPQFQHLLMYLPPKEGKMQEVSQGVGLLVRDDEQEAPGFSLFFKHNFFDGIKMHFIVIGLYLEGELMHIDVRDSERRILYQTLANESLTYDIRPIDRHGAFIQSALADREEFAASWDEVWKKTRSVEVLRAPDDLDSLPFKVDTEIGRYQENFMSLLELATILPESPLDPDEKSSKLDPDQVAFLAESLGLEPANKDSKSSTEAPDTMEVHRGMHGRPSLRNYVTGLSYPSAGTKEGAISYRICQDVAIGMVAQILDRSYFFKPRSIVAPPTSNLMPRKKDLIVAQETYDWTQDFDSLKDIYWTDFLNLVRTMIEDREASLPESMKAPEKEQEKRD